MAKAKLTNTFIKKIPSKINSARVDYFDTELSGFMCEVRKTGTITYYYRYTKNYKTTMHKLGTADTMSADEARRLALKIKKAIATDSLEKLFIKKSSAPTLKEFYYKHYLPSIKLQHKSWCHNDSAYRVHILPALGDKRMDEIQPHHIKSLIMDVINKKKLGNGSANKVLVYIKHAYNMALELKIDGIKENPAAHIKSLHEEHRERYLTKMEAKRLLKAVDESNNTSLKYIIRFLLLTGARRGEVLRAAWKDIDLVNMVWTIPITKNKKIRKVPISKELLEVINSIPKTSEWLFPAKRTTGHYTSITAAWDHARKKAGLPDVRIHDLRHSFASTLVNSGCNLYEVQRLLGHSDLKMTQRYAHLSDDSLIKAASCAGNLIN